MTSSPKPHRWPGMALAAMLLAASALTVGPQALFPAPAVAMTDDQEGVCESPDLEFWEWQFFNCDDDGGSGGGSSGGGSDDSGSDDPYDGLDDCAYGGDCDDDSGEQGAGDDSNPFPDDWGFSDGDESPQADSPPTGQGPGTNIKGHEVIIVVDKAAKETDEQESAEACFKRNRALCGVNCPPEKQCLHIIPNHKDDGREWPHEHTTPQKPYLPKNNHKKRSLELLMRWIPQCVAAKKKLDDLTRLRRQGWSDQNWEDFGKKKQQTAAEIVWRSHECGRILVQT